MVLSHGQVPKELSQRWQISVQSLDHFPHENTLLGSNELSITAGLQGLVTPRRLRVSLEDGMSPLSSPEVLGVLASSPSPGPRPWSLSQQMLTLYL